MNDGMGKEGVCLQLVRGEGGGGRWRRRGAGGG